MLNTYIDSSATIAISSNVSHNSAIGANTEIDEDSYIHQSVLGSECKIGKNVRITDSIIEADVVINEGCIVENAHIRQGSILEKHSKVTGGTIVCKNIHIKEGVTIPEGSICGNMKYDESSQGFVESNETNQEFFVKGNISYLPLNLKLKDT